MGNIRSGLHAERSDLFGRRKLLQKRIIAEEIRLSKPEMQCNVYRTGWLKISRVYL